MSVRGRLARPLREALTIRHRGPLHLQPPVHLRTSCRAETHYDVIIIGTGAGGGTLAYAGADR